MEKKEEFEETKSIKYEPDIIIPDLSEEQMEEQRKKHAPFISLSKESEQEEIVSTDVPKTSFVGQKIPVSTQQSVTSQIIKTETIFNIDKDRKFLRHKTYRTNNEFPVLRLKLPKYDINYRDEDNMDIVERDKYFNKLKYDILQMPDLAPKFTEEELQSNIFKYNIRENIRSFKPLITNEGRNISFTIQSDVFIDNNYLILNLKITNPNLNNYLQYDINPIKHLTITNNSQLVEEIFDYALIEDLEHDFNYYAEYYNQNNKSLVPLCLDTKGLLIPPKTKGTNIIFNPYQTVFNYPENNKINEGKISFLSDNSKIMKIRINSHVLGRHHTKKQHFEGLDQNLTPLFLYQCLQINLELNEYAFFVPVFNARIQDLTNISVNDTDYEFARLINSQNNAISKLISNLKFKERKFSKVPRTNTTIYNSIFKSVDKLGTDPWSEKRNLFKLFSYYLNGTIMHAETIEKKIVDYLKNNRNIAQNILAFTHQLGYDILNIKYYEKEKIGESEILMDKMIVEQKIKELKNDIGTSAMIDKTNIFRFTKKSLLQAYIDRNEKILFHLNGATGELAYFSSLVDIYAFSEIEQIPIELYICLTVEHTEATEVNFTTLQFVTLINGYINKPVMRIALDEGAEYGMILDLTDEHKMKYLKMLNTDDIFLIRRDNYMEGSIESGRSAVDLLNMDFFSTVLRLSFKENSIRNGPEGMSAALLLRCIDKDGYLLPYFALKKFDIAKIFFRQNYGEFANIMDLPNVYNSEEYSRSDLLDGLYEYSFMNYFYDQKGKPKIGFRIYDPIYETSFFLSLLLFTSKGIIEVNTLPETITPETKQILINEYKDEMEEMLNDYTLKKGNDYITKYKSKIDEFTSANLFTQIKMDIKKLEKYKNGKLNRPITILKKRNENSELIEEELQFFTDREKYMNPKFIEDLLVLYGSLITYEILKNVMPDLFDYNNDNKMILKLLTEAETTTGFEWRKLWGYITNKFIQQFKTTRDLLTYNPFKKYERFFTKYQLRKVSLREKMSELASQVKNISFDLLLYKEHKMLPVIGYLAKLQHYLKKYPGNIMEYVGESIVEMFFIEKLRQLVLTSINDIEVVDSSEKEAKFEITDTRSYVWLKGKNIFTRLKQSISAVTKVSTMAYIATSNIIGTISSALSPFLPSFFSKEAAGVCEVVKPFANTCLASANQVVPAMTSFLSALGPMGWCGIAAIGSYAAYKLYNAWHQKNSYARINEINGEGDMEKINNELILDLTTASRFFYLEKDYENLYRSYDSINEINDVKKFAEKIKEGCTKMIQKYNADNIKIIFEPLFEKLSKYTKEKMDEYKEKMVDNTNAKYLKKKISDNTLKLADYNKNLNDMLSKNVNFMKLLTDENLMLSTEKDIDKLLEEYYKGYPEERRIIPPSLEQKEKLVAYKTEFGLKKIMFDETIELKNEYDNLTIIHSQEIEAIKNFNKIYSLYTKKEGSKLYKAILNNKSNAEFKTYINGINQEIVEQMKIKNSMYEALHKISDYISKLKKVESLTLDLYLRISEKIIMYHFKLEHPEFSDNFKENNMIMVFKNRNNAVEEEDNLIFTSNNLMYEMVSNKSDFEALINKYKKRQDMMQGFKILTKNSPENNPINKLESVYFRKYNVKTEFTEDQIKAIKHQFKNEIQHKNLPFIFDTENWNHFIKLLSDIHGEQSKISLKTDSYWVKIKKYLADLFNVFPTHSTTIKGLILKINLFKEKVETMFQSKINIINLSKLEITDINKEIKITKPEIKSLYDYIFLDLYTMKIDPRKILERPLTSIEQDLILNLMTLGRIEVTDDLFDNTINILINKDLTKLNEDLVQGSKPEDNINQLLNSISKIVSQVDWSILAEAIVEGLKVSEDKNTVNYYYDETEDKYPNISIEDKRLDVPEGSVVDYGLVNDLLRELSNNEDLAINTNGKKYFNKTVIPNANEIYKTTNLFVDDDFLSTFIIIEKVENVGYKNENKIFKKLETPDLIKINKEMQTDFTLTIDENKENLSRLYEYYNTIKQRMNEIFYYFTFEYDKKNIYSTTIIEIFRKIFVNLSKQDDEISMLILLSMADIFFNISLNLMEYGFVSRSDIAKLDELPIKINSYIKTFNLGKNANLKTIEIMLDELNDPETYEKIMDDLQKEFVKIMNPAIHNQKEYLINNKEQNFSNEMRLSRQYLAESEFLIKEIRFDGDNILKKNILSNPTSHFITGTKLKINSRMTFNNKIPPDIFLSFYRPFKNLYFIILNKENLVYPTYRYSTRYNKNIAIFGCEVNNIKFPPYFVSGKSNSSLLNDQFMENLNHSLNINKTSINKYNFALNKSTSLYITKKIYGKSEDMFEFEDNSNVYLDFRFGYHNEILGKAVFSLSFEQIYFLMNNKIPLDQLNIKLFIEDKSQVDEEKENYELLIIEENDFEYTFSPY